METTVKLKHLRQSATKIRFVLKEINGLSVDKALNKLLFINKKASFFILKAIKSGLSNLNTNNQNFDREELFIINSFVDQGPTMKRFRPAAMGRAMRIRKRTSHLTITLSNKKG